MRTKLLALLMVLCGMSNAQEILYSYDSKEITGLLASTVYLVQSGDPVFDSCVNASMKKYWTLTPYKIISMAELSDNIEDKTKYFMACMDLNDNNYIFTSPMKSPTHKKVNFYKVPPSATTAGMFLFHGDKHYKTDFANTDRISSCSFPLYDRKCANACTDYVIKNISDNLKIILDNKLDPNKHAARTITPIGEAFSTNPQLLKDRTLLIPEALKEDILKEKTIAPYKYKYQYASDADILSMIAANPGAYCFIPVVSSNIEVYDPVTKSKIYIGPTDTMTPTISSKEVKDLNEAVDGTAKKKWK